MIVKLEHPGNVPNVDTQQLMDELNYCVADKEHRLLIWGAPGIGKTQIVNQVAKKHGIKMIDLQLANMSPEDFFLPKVARDEMIATRNKREVTVFDERSTRVVIDELPLYHEDDPNGDANANGPDGKGGILFLDEISRATPPVQNICLKLINERKIGKYILGSNWTIVSAANRESDDNSPYSFSTALANRFTSHVNFVPDAESWAKWAMTATDENGEQFVHSTIISFMSFDKSQFYELDPEAQAELWPSPRSWAAAARAVHGKTKLLRRELSQNEAYETVERSVGKTAALKYLDFLKLIHEINPEDIALVYRDPKKAPLPPVDKNSGMVKSGIGHAWYSSIGYYLRDKPVTPQQLTNLFEYVVKVDDPQWAPIAAEIARRILRDRIDADPKLVEAETEGVNAFMRKYPGFIKEHLRKFIPQEKKDK